MINSQVPAAMADVCQDKATLSLADRILMPRVPIQNSAMLKPISIVNWKSRDWCSMDWTILTYVRTHQAISHSSVAVLSPRSIITCVVWTISSNPNCNITVNRLKFSKTYVDNSGNSYGEERDHADSYSLLFNSLSKSTSTSSTVPPTPRSIPTPRTATIKFDYDASDSNELSVLAKEVEIAVAQVRGMVSSLFFSDCQCTCRREWEILVGLWLDHHWEAKFQRTWTHTTCLFAPWFLLVLIEFPRWNLWCALVRLPNIWRLYSFRVSCYLWISLLWYMFRLEHAHLGLLAWSPLSRFLYANDDTPFTVCILSNHSSARLALDLSFLFLIYSRK